MLRLRSAMWLTQRGANDLEATAEDGMYANRVFLKRRRRGLL